MEKKLQNGDVLIIGGSPFMIIDYWEGREDGTKGKFKHCLLCLRTFTTDLLMEEPDLEIGDSVFGEEKRVEAIIPKDKISISYKIFG